MNLRTTLSVLLEDLTKHVNVLLDHTYVAPVHQERRGWHAVGAWHAVHQIAEQALEPRWAYAAEALLAGRSLADLAEGSHLTSPEVAVGLNRWLDASVKSGEITEERRAQVRALIGGAR